MKRANYFPLALITAAVLLSMVVTFWLTDREQNQRRRVVLRNQSANTTDQVAGSLRDREQELRAWGVGYLQTAETTRQLRPDLEPEQRDQFVSLGQAASLGERFDLVLVVDTSRRIRSVAAPDAARSASARRWLQHRYTDVLPGGSARDEDWLAPAFETGRPVALGWAAIEAVNRLYERDAAQPGQALATHQIAIAVPLADGSAAPQYAVAGVLRWRYFQDILDRNEQLLKDAGLPSGYSYLIDTDADTVIGHKNQDLLAVPLKSLVASNPGLDPFRLAVARSLKTGQPEFQPYHFPSSTSKTAFLYPFGHERTQHLPSQLHWVLGVGADDRDLREAVRNDFGLFLLPSAVVCFAAGGAYLLWARRYRATFGEVVDTIKRARSLDEVSAACRTEAHYNELIEAAGALIVRSREGSLFTTIPNSYVVGRPISDGRMFFGRGQELDAISRQLREPGNELLILAGQRRIGKTSLLYQIRQQNHGCTCVFVDTQRIAPSVASDGDLYEKLYEAIARAMDSPPEKPLSRGEQFPVQQLNDLMREVHRRAVRIVLLVDEFENLEDLLARDKMTQAPLLWIAAQLEGLDPFSMIVTGSEGMQLPSRTWHKLGAKAQRRRITFLKQADAEALVRNPLLGFATFSGDTVAAILRLTGCHPLMTQDFCYRLVSRLNAERVSEVKPLDVESVAQDLIENAPPWIEDAWSRLTEAERVALRLIVTRLPDGETYAEPADALAQLSVDAPGPGLAGGTLRNAINTLLEKEWLEKAGRLYRLRCDLHRRWIGEYHPLDAQHVGKPWSREIRTS